MGFINQGMSLCSIQSIFLLGIGGIVIAIQVQDPMMVAIWVVTIQIMGE